MHGVRSDCHNPHKTITTPNPEHNKVNTELQSCLIRAPAQRCLDTFIFVLLIVDFWMSCFRGRETIARTESLQTMEVKLIKFFVSKLHHRATSFTLTRDNEMATSLLLLGRRQSLRERQTY
jgi:hypothetical protein